MLRSLIKQIDPVARARGGAVGLAIGRERVAAVIRSDARSPDDARVAELSTRCFVGAPDASAAQALAGAIESVVSRIKNTFTPVHVALPDPFVALAAFEMEAIPAGERAKRQLACWRIAKEIDAEERLLDVAYQELGVVNGKPALFVQAGSAAWMNCVRNALSAANVTPWSINQACIYRFNHFHDRIVTHGISGAMLSLDPDAWAVLIWDSTGRIRHLRSRWRAAKPSKREHQAIGEEFERSVLAYVHGEPGRNVGQIYISTSESERDSMTRTLNDRLQEACVPLSTDESPSDSIPLGELARICAQTS